ncbi:hypothetical protein INS49_009793 [Diaporthe citri]|uniref:uncharacterized protein n=1 Tax=Diaporthe citri TaxID=83186 RepID=UPI001C7E40F1|nr:uncharacterized protein INS49_009793 [Diaporthe citri]KAG6361566.1 hypothetical protein INS49_009793 [Diaporthe citri]
MYLPLLTFLVGTCPLLGLAVPHAGVAQPRSSAIRGKYLVAIKPESSPAQLREHTSWVQGVHARNLRKRQSSGETAAGVERTFSFDGFRGYSGSFDEETLEDIKWSKEVALVEPDQKLTLDSIQGDIAEASSRSWGLDRISHREPNNGTKYTYVSDPNATGRGQYVYVVDMGIQANHTEFEGRVIKGFNVWENYTAFEDTFGHGTHVAGTIGDRTVGIAKDVTLVDVKAFWGANLAVNDILKNGRANSYVINMSFGYSEPPDITVELINAGVQPGSPWSRGSRKRQRFITDRTPGRVPNSFTVSASDRADNRVFFSNWGPGVDAFAPGFDIYSAWVGSNTSTCYLLSSTSMATPHVAGLMAYLKAVHAEAPNISAAAITQRIKNLAPKGVIKDPRGSPNLLINNNSGAWREAC